MNEIIKSKIKQDKSARFVEGEKIEIIANPAIKTTPLITIKPQSMLVRIDLLFLALRAARKVITIEAIATEIIIEKENELSK